MGMGTTIRSRLRKAGSVLRSGTESARGKLPEWRERARRVAGFLRSTPRRTFMLYPCLVVLAELVERRGRLRIDTIGLPIMLWGYSQYRLVGAYRQRQAAGSRGFGGGNMPDRLLQSGPYEFTRNPMYLGHLIFLFGLGTTFRSKTGDLLLVANALWFHWRVLKDERLLRRKFETEYEDYTARVKRWVPYFF